MNKGIKLLVAIQLMLVTSVFGINDTTLSETSVIELTADIFENVSVKPGEESAKITWGLSHEAYSKLKNRVKNSSLLTIQKLERKDQKPGIVVETGCSLNQLALMQLHTNWKI